MRDIVLECVQLSVRKPGETAKLLAQSLFVNGPSILLCLPQSLAHTCSPSISFILGSRCMYLKPFLCIGALLCYLSIKSHHTPMCVCTHTVSFSLEQWCSLVEGAAWLDKGRLDLISETHFSHRALV